MLKILIILILCTISSDIKKLIIFYRHGHRNSIDMMASSYEQGALTEAGIRQHYVLGKFLRHKYNNFLKDEDYQLSCIASGIKRTHDSFLSNSFSLFNKKLKFTYKNKKIGMPSYKNSDKYIKDSDEVFNNSNYNPISMEYQQNYYYYSIEHCPEIKNNNIEIFAIHFENMSKKFGYFENLKEKMFNSKIYNKYFHGKKNNKDEINSTDLFTMADVIISNMLRKDTNDFEEDLYNNLAEYTTLVYLYHAKFNYKYRRFRLIGKKIKNILSSNNKYMQIFSCHDDVLANMLIRFIPNIYDDFLKYYDDKYNKKLENYEMKFGATHYSSVISLEVLEDETVRIYYNDKYYNFNYSNLKNLNEVLDEKFIKEKMDVDC